MDISRATLRTAASLADHPDFIIGTLEVSPSMRTVKAAGDVEKVEPRVMQVLIALAEAWNEVLTRDALFDRCWGGVYVGDDSLNRAIAGVRRIATGIGEAVSRSRRFPEQDTDLLPKLRRCGNPNWIFRDPNPPPLWRAKVCREDGCW